MVHCAARRRGACTQYDRAARGRQGEDHRRARLARRRQVQVRLCALAVMPPQVDRQYTRLWAVLKSGR
ncbi:hypothetical protein ACFQGW_21690 [Xanthomonas theicola]|uniref:hypothetical protein n=1 Tax=Xanthomonas theicola TaxID=56464 RepID=UPI0036149CF0